MSRPSEAEVLSAKLHSLAEKLKVETVSNTLDLLLQVIEEVGELELGVAPKREAAMLLDRAGYLSVAGAALETAISDLLDALESMANRLGVRQPELPLCERTARAAADDLQLRGETVAAGYGPGATWD